MGTGKTFVAGAVIRELNVPTLVAVPAVSVSGWNWMARHLGIGFSVESLDLLRGGNTPYGRWENPLPKARPLFFQCENCQCKFDAPPDYPCPARGVHCLKTLKREHDYGKFTWHPKIELLVVDEIHKCGGLDSLQADQLIAARRQKIPVLGLSATACDSPLGLRALGYVLGLHDLVGPGGFFAWAMRRGCQRLPFRGFHFTAGEERKKKIMRDLHADIFPGRGVRVRIADLGDKFPKCRITAELYNVADPARIDRLYRTMAESIADIHDKRERGGDTALENLLRARQELEMLKLPIFQEITRDAQEAGQSVAVFLNFRESVLEFARMLKTTCIVIGGQSKEERDRNIGEFQDDRARGIVLSADAGGISISLPDVRGEFPRLGLVNLGFSARTTRQIFGRLPRISGKSPVQYRVILCGGTVEEPMRDAMQGKLDRMDLLNDGDLSPLGNIPLTDSEECGKF